MISILLASIVPTFGIIFIGWLCRKLNVWKKQSVEVMNSYAYYIALPALIFYALFKVDIASRDLMNDGLIIVAVLLAHAVIFLLFLPFLKSRWLSRDVRAIVPILIAFGNTAYLGIPFATFTFGTEGTILASILSVVLVVVILFFSILHLNSFARPSIKRDVLRTVLELPFLWAVVIGVGWSFMHFPMPIFLEHFVKILSDSAGPTALLGLGAFLFDVPLAHIPWKHTIIISSLKVTLPVFLTAGILFSFGISGLPFYVGLAMSATPTAVTTFILSAQYKLGQQLTAGVIFVSVFFSLIALTIISALWLV